MRPSINLTPDALEQLAMALYDDYRLGKYSANNKDNSPMWHQLDQNSIGSWTARAYVVYQTVLNQHLTDKLKEKAAKKKMIKRHKKTIYKKKNKKKNSKRS